MLKRAELRLPRTEGATLEYFMVKTWRRKCGDGDSRGTTTPTALTVADHRQVELSSGACLETWTHPERRKSTAYIIRPQRAPGIHGALDRPRRDGGDRPELYWFTKSHFWGNKLPCIIRRGDQDGNVRLMDDGTPRNTRQAVACAASTTATARESYLRAGPQAVSQHARHRSLLWLACWCSAMGRLPVP